MDDAISELDSQRFGFKVAKLNAFEISPFDSILELKRQDVKLVISRVGTEDVTLINKMEEAGFRLKDVQVTYNFDLSRDIPEQAGNGIVTCRSHDASDQADLIRIAAESFQDYGHYSRSEKTRSVGSAAIYADWARRFCSDRNLADYIVVGEIGGIVGGFLSLKIHQAQRRRYAAGVMGAVGRDCRKGGVFRAINIASLHWAKGAGLERVENNVLVTNYAVNKTYASLGFHITRSEATLHCWID
jgi:hypothetical protein